MDRLGMNVRGKQDLTPDNSAMASELFDRFCNASTLKTILGYHRQLCDVLNLKPNHFPAFYPKLKQHVNSWKAKALWKKFDIRASHKCYARGKACANTRVLIVGAGPCGLRTAIEAQLLGAKVVVVEKRDRMSRNNVLHLWPFVIEDLRALGAKKFFGKFCAGSIDHISIRQLQCILLKVALLLGVEIHTEISFAKLIPPPSKEESQERLGWRGSFVPVDHPVAQYEFDVLIGADGRRNTLEGFKRKEFRGRLAIAITANFINKRTEAEARVEEISGVAFIFNQKFFKELYEATGIDLENIVYYKDETHYFVMTAKKQSLLDKGVILNDIADTSKLLGRENVSVDELQNYAREAADFSTLYQMPDLEFAVNHYGNPDVNMFDFTSMYAAENASKVLERNGHRLLMILVGDSLLEPFWPTGSGCARGFLSSMDACWALRSWGSGTTTPLEVLAERESIYRLLGQTTPENLQRDSKSYTLDPSSRYPNLNKSSLLPLQVTSLYDTDDPNSIQAMITAPPLTTATTATNTSLHELHKKRRRKDSQVHPDTLLHWLKRQVAHYEDLYVNDLTTTFKDGLVLCAVIHRYRPDLLDFHSLKKDDIAYNNQLAFDILEKELGIPPVMTGQEMADCSIPDLLTMLSYITQIYDTFRGEIPHIKHPKLDLPELKKLERIVQPKDFVMVPRVNIAAGPVPNPRFSMKHREKEHTNKRYGDHTHGQLVNNSSSSNHHHHHHHHPDQITERKTRKRRSVDKIGASLDRDVKMPGSLPRGEKDEEFSGRIKDFEDKLRETAPQEKKPKDLLRAIGKIESNDWNVKEIEKKIIENKMGKSVNREKEKVPKWSAEQFLARRTKMEKKGLDRQDSEDKKFVAIDKSIKQLDQKLKEGNTRELNTNKVSSITEQFKKQPEEPKPIQKSNSKVIVPAPGGSENCHFCTKRVYLMERLSAEGRFFHRGCFRCQYCNTSLRLGSYLFDREGKFGHRFYCSQHFGMTGQLKTVSGTKASGKKGIARTPDKVHDIASVDLIERVQTPERIEFSNMSPAGGISDHEESFSQMDEDEWTDRNFGASTAEIGSSDDDDDSSESDSETDDEVFEEALDVPVTKEGTQRIAKEWVKRYSKDKEQDMDDESCSPNDYDTGSDFSYENSTDDDESETATEGEEEIRARELRKQEVRVKQPIVQIDTGSDTEMQSDEETSNESSSDKENSATDIPTDSEFDHDDRTPTSEFRSAFHDGHVSKSSNNRSVFNDMYVTKTRGSGKNYYNEAPPKRVQVKSGELQRPISSQKTNKNVSNNGGGGGTGNGNIELQFTSLTPSKVQQHQQQQKIYSTTPDVTNVRPSPLVNPRKGDYLLNRTQSTGGIASKVSLELKKKYLLGSTGLPGSIQKSGSATTLDSKFKSFTSKISEHQKLLNPAPEISPTMQAFLQGTSKIRTPLSPTGLTAKSPTFPAVTITPPPTGTITMTTTTTTTETPILTATVTVDKTELKSPEIIDLTLSPNDKFSMQPDITKDLLPLDSKNLNGNDSPKFIEELNENDNITTAKPDVVYTNDTEGRPRSPVHETSIIVPEITWNNKPEKKSESDIDTDSLSSSESSSSNGAGGAGNDNNDDDDNGKMDEKSIGKSVFNDIPRVEVHDTTGVLLKQQEDDDNDDDDNDVVEDMVMDSLLIIPSKDDDDSKKNNVTDDDQNKPTQPGSLASSIDAPKSILSDKKTLNQPKLLPGMNNAESTLDNKCHEQKTLPPSHQHEKESKSESGRNTPLSDPESVCNDATNAALTETELSDWARDGNVSDNLEDVDFDMDADIIEDNDDDDDYKDKSGKNQRSHNKKLKGDTKKKNNVRTNARIAMIEDFDDTGHICGKQQSPPANVKYQQQPANGCAPIADIADLDSIEYMDTGSEVSLDENLIETTNTGLLKNRGYVHFVNNDTITHPVPIKSTVTNYDDSSLPLDSLNVIQQPPKQQQQQHEIINNNGTTVEAINKNVILPLLSSVDQNTGYCVYGNENENEQQQRQQQQQQSPPPHKLLSVIDNEEPGTTTEENTISDSTVKNLINESKLEKTLTLEIEKLVEHKQKNTKSNNDTDADEDNNDNDDDDEEEVQTPIVEQNGIEYEKHVKRLESKFVEFGYVRDSIDVRKSKRKNQSDSPPPIPTTPLPVEQQSIVKDTITTNIINTSSPSRVLSPLSSISSPATSRKLEEINKERCKQHDLIRDLVLDKVKQKKPGDKKRRTRESFSPSCSPIRKNFELCKSATVDLTPTNSLTPTVTAATITTQSTTTPYSSLSSGFYEQCKTPDTIPLQRSPTISEFSTYKETNRTTTSSSSSSTRQDDGKENIMPSKSFTGGGGADIFTPVTSLKDLNPKTLARPLSMHGSFIVSSVPLKHSSITPPSSASSSIQQIGGGGVGGGIVEATFSLPNIHNNDPLIEFKTPVAPPRTRHHQHYESDAKRTTEKLKQEARERARLKSDEDLGLSPEDKMNMHRQKANKLHLARQNSKEQCIQDSIESLVLNTEKRILNDTLKKKKQNANVTKNRLQNSFSNSDIPNKFSFMYSKNSSRNNNNNNNRNSYDDDDNDNDDDDDNNLELNRTKSVSELCKTFNNTGTSSSTVTDGTNKFYKHHRGEQYHQQLKQQQQHQQQQQQQQLYKSDPNLLTEECGKKEKKTKDRERRKSIIKSVTEFFHKKKDPSATSSSSSPSKGTSNSPPAASSSSSSPPSSNATGAMTAAAAVKDRFSRFRISPKSKEKSKEQSSDMPPTRSKSLSDNSLKDSGNVSPPPIPPPPLNYTATSVTRDDTGSDSESEWKKLNHSSETLDQSCTSAIEGTGNNSLGRRRVSRSLRKSSKQAQIKRHRLAQEIQRKLEETEVKTRELEQRGVLVEKALRGETTSDDDGNTSYHHRDESELLREWFDLMRDRTELRRYEKELLVRAQELELEDRHARLQQELRDRLAGDDKVKTQADVEAEGEILTEMLEIVAKRDSLIALLEEDRQRYHNEDRDFEAQMLAKGLRLTPIKKTPD